MSYLKARLFALLLILIGAGLIYYNWQQLWSDHEYSLKLAAFAPLCVVGGLFLLLASFCAGSQTSYRMTSCHLRDRLCA